MPPRYAYWTILIDDKPTAFRAQKQEDLLPTLKQLSRANPNIVMKWFARGRLWESPEQARWAYTNAPRRRERRGPGWRPGAGPGAEAKRRPAGTGGRPPGNRDRPPKAAKPASGARSGRPHAAAHPRRERTDSWKPSSFRPAGPPRNRPSRPPKRRR